MSRLHILQLSTVILVLFLLGFTGYSVLHHGTDDPTPQPGYAYDPPVEVSDFTLTSHTGDPVSLSDERGKAVLIFFGYTFCPDVCPTTLAEFRRVKTLLGDDANRLAVLFISVDGQRDTPDRLATYVTAFDPTFIGLTGDDAAIRQIGQDYGLFYQRETYENTGADYLVSHTASSFLLDPQGRLRFKYDYQTPPEDIATGVRFVLDE
jgi:protein SCO1/2